MQPPPISAFWPIQSTSGTRSPPPFYLTDEPALSTRRPHPPARLPFLSQTLGPTYRHSPGRPLRARRGQSTNALTPPCSPLPFLQPPFRASLTHAEAVVPTTCIKLGIAHAVGSFEPPATSFSPPHLISLTSPTQNHRTAPKPPSRRRPTVSKAPPTSAPRWPPSMHRVIKPPTTEHAITTWVSIPLTSPLPRCVC
jgi:hypothetical protein